MNENKDNSGNNQNDRFSHTVSLAVIVLFMAMLLTPLILLAATGQDKTVLDGEKQHEAPSFTLSGFVSAEFQGDFEAWFSTKYPLRGDFVAAYRQLQFDTSNIGFDITTLFVPKVPPETDAPETEPDQSDEQSTGDETVMLDIPTSPYSDFNELYTEMNRRLHERTPIEQSGYKGTDQVVIGKSGYCYENGYINELYGYSQKYRNCTDEFLTERADKLSYIQTRLKEMGIAFTLIISPSKASEYEQYIPDWYKAQNSVPDGYVRPVTRLIPILEEKGVNFIDCASYYDEIGLDETFPLTGIHWNKPAAYEATKALLDAYEEQTGIAPVSINATGIVEQKDPTNFGNPEADIFNIAYSGVNTNKAIRDELYYYPEIESINEDSDKINVLMQGGSFTGDFQHYLQQYRITKQFKRFYYNSWQGVEDMDPFKVGDEAWSSILAAVDYVIFECNEQYVCMMGTNAPSWGSADRAPLPDNANDVYESLYNYLKSTENN